MFNPVFVSFVLNISKTSYSAFLICKNLSLRSQQFSVLGIKHMHLLFNFFLGLFYVTLNMPPPLVTLTF